MGQSSSTDAALSIFDVVAVRFFSAGRLMRLSAKLRRLHRWKTSCRVHFCEAASRSARARGNLSSERGGASISSNATSFPTLLSLRHPLCVAVKLPFDRELQLSLLFFLQHDAILKRSVTK